MLSIDNMPLPVPAALTWKQPAPLTLTAQWPALTAPQMGALLGPTARPFTLLCLDPLTGLERSFPARRRAMRAQALGQGLHHLTVTFEETV